MEVFWFCFASADFWTNTLLWHKNTNLKTKVNGPHDSAEMWTAHGSLTCPFLPQREYACLFAYSCTLWLPPDTPLWDTSNGEILALAFPLSTVLLSVRKLHLRNMIYQLLQKFCAYLIKGLPQWLSGTQEASCTVSQGAGNIRMKLEASLYSSTALWDHK